MRVGKEERCISGVGALGLGGKPTTGGPGGKLSQSKESRVESTSTKGEKGKGETSSTGGFNLL